MAASQENTMRPVFADGLRLPMQIPEWWKNLTPEQTAHYINEQMVLPIYIAAAHRYMEWQNLDSPFDVDSVDLNRRKIGYYALAREIQEKSDAFFFAMRPDEADETERAVGIVDHRWRLAQTLVYAVSDIVHEPKREDFRMSHATAADYTLDDYLARHWLGKPKKCIVHGRAKSTFSTWSKMLHHHVDADELGDMVGIQVLVEDDNHARDLHETILQYASSHPGIFTLEQPRTYRRQNQRALLGLPAQSAPIRDYLDKPKDKYRAIRTNYVYVPTGSVFEVQVTPIDVYNPPNTYLNHLADKARRPVQ